MQNVTNTSILNNGYVPRTTIMGIIYIWRKHAKKFASQVTLWDQGNLGHQQFFWKNGLSTFKYEKNLCLETLNTYKSFHC